MNELALFAGAGGGILGGKLLGWRTVCAVEIEPYAAAVLCARQNDGILPPFPIWDDVRTFDGRPWRGIVDVVSGGFPCQDISAAGKGAGIDGTRSGLWFHMARIIGEVRPRFAFVENSPMLTSRGLGRVLGDLAEMGYDAKWGVLGACDAGAPHKRDRIWIVANAMSARQRRKPRQGEDEGDVMADATLINRRTRQLIKQTPSIWSSWNNEPSWSGETLANANSTQREGNERAIGIEQERTNARRPSWWTSEPDVGRVADGVAAILDNP